MKNYRISGLVELSVIQQLAEAHYRATGMPSAILDARDGSILVAAGWQDICTLFHRAHPASLKNCQESDTHIKSHLADGEACQYQCKNGLWDVAVPIVVDDQHLATIFLGQFFYEGEIPDREYFIRQANEFGYDLREYLAALDRLPVFSREKVANLIAYNRAFSHFIAQLAERSIRAAETEQSLRDSESKFRVLTETSPAAIFLYQREKIVYANPSTAKMLGFPEEELLQMRFWEWVHPDFKEMVQNLGLFQQWDDAMPLQFECKFVTRSGKERWGFVSTGRIEYGGKPAGIAIIHDISKQKRMEEGLRKSEEQFRLAMEASSDGLWDWDIKADRTYFSPACYRMLGYEPREFPMTSQSWLDLMHPDDRERVVHVHNYCIENRVQSFENEFRMKTKAGNWKWVLGRGKAVNRDANGKALRLIGTHVDITERKLAEEALRKSNQRLDLLAETANQLLKSDSPQEVVDSLCRKVLGFLDCDAFFNYLVDDEEKRLHLNACAGIPEEDVRKMEWLDYGVGLCGCAARDGRRLVVENLQGEQDQYSALVRPFGINAYACHPLISRGKVLGTLSFCRRHTGRFSEDEMSLMKAVADQVAIAIDRKRAEDELRRTNNELDKRVAERTEQLNGAIDRLKTEIAERNKTEVVLRNSEERYALAVEGVNDGIWDHDYVTGKIFLSPRWKSMLGYDDDKIMNDREEWTRRIHPDDYKRVRQALSDYLDGKTPEYRVEYRMRHKDGSYRWILAKGACLRDSRGKPYRMTGSHTDVTERKRAEEELRKNEELLRIILETLPVGVVVFDREGKKILENRARKSIWGVTEGEVSPLEDLEEYKGWFADSGKQLEREDWPVFKAVSEGVTEGKIIEIECCDGTRKTVIATATPLKIGGQIVAAIGVLDDITEQKRLEHQLLQAQKMESIGLLAGGVAHEFNNLLTAISACCEELHESADAGGELVRSNIRMIQSIATEAADLTRSLLAFGRQQVLMPKPVSINGVIDDVGKILMRTLGENIRFSTDLSTENLVVMADSGQLKQVVFNLVINAKDAMPAGGHVQVRTWRTHLADEMARRYDLEKRGGYAAISVADHGIGMDEKTMEKIFEPFFTTKEIGKGTGLGLSIIYGIIKQHNGSINVESKPGEGSCFTVYLPLVETSCTRTEPREKICPERAAETILVVDDEPLVRSFLENTLGRAGYSILTAQDGEEAIAQFREHLESISLIISDIMMPRLTGSQMYERIRTMKPDIKVLFVSGYSLDLLEKKGMPGDYVDIITKPFMKKELLEKTRNLLDGVKKGT